MGCVILAVHLANVVRTGWIREKGLKMNNVKSNVDMKASAEITGLGRGERVTGKRRSMML